MSDTMNETMQAAAGRRGSVVDSALLLSFDRFPLLLQDLYVTPRCRPAADRVILPTAPDRHLAPPLDASVLRVAK